MLHECPPDRCFVHLYIFKKCTQMVAKFVIAGTLRSDLLLYLLNIQMQH